MPCIIKCSISLIPWTLGRCPDKEGAGVPHYHLRTARSEHTMDTRAPSLHEKRCKTTGGHSVAGKDAQHPFPGPE